MVQPEVSTKAVMHVTAGIIVENHRVLAARRKFGGSLAGMWEFPGGKVELRETPADCLVRELYEELGITAFEVEPFDYSYFEYGVRRVLLHGFTVGRFEGIPEPRIHEEIGWVDIDELPAVEFAPADVPLMRRIIKTHLRFMKPGAERGVE